MDNAGHFFPHAVNPETVGQYVGLKDMHGKEIYEGDVIPEQTVVVWREDLASFALRKEDWLFDHYFGEAVDPGSTQIIGNIHDSPELLNK